MSESEGHAGCCKDAQKKTKRHLQFNSWCLCPEISSPLLFVALNSLILEANITLLRYARSELGRCLQDVSGNTGGSQTSTHNIKETSNPKET